MIAKYFAYLRDFRQHAHSVRSALRHWFREDARYFCLSTLIHAIFLLSLGLVQWQVISHLAGEEGTPEIASFKPAETEQSTPPDRVDVIIERGNAPLEPSVLSRETIAELEALPVGVESGEKDVKEDEIGDPDGNPLGNITSMITFGTGGTGDHGSPGVSKPGPGPMPGPGRVGVYDPRLKKGAGLSVLPARRNAPWRPR